MGSLVSRLVLRHSRRIGGRILDSGDNLVLFRRILLFVSYAHFVSNQAQFISSKNYLPIFNELEKKTYLQV